MLVAACSMTYLCTWRALSAASRCPPRYPSANDNLPRGLRPMGLPDAHHRNELGWVEGRSYLRGGVTAVPLHRASAHQGTYRHHPGQNQLYMIGSPSRGGGPRPLDLGYSQSWSGVARPS